MGNKIAFAIVMAFFLFSNGLSTLSADSFEVYIITNDGAFLRDTPSINGRIIQKLDYGQVIEVLQEGKDTETISLMNVPYSGVWFRVKAVQHQGCIFSALVSPKIADEFVCQQQNAPQNIEISDLDVKIELCNDGSFYLDEGYERKGACSLHGCWRLRGGRIEISKRKQFRVKGIGKPIRCTHLCEHEKYHAETTVWAMQPYLDSPVQLDDFEEKVSTQKDDPPNLKFSSGAPTCRRNYLFGKPR